MIRKAKPRRNYNYLKNTPRLRFIGRDEHQGWHSLSLRMTPRSSFNIRLSMQVSDLESETKPSILINCSTPNRKKKKQFKLNGFCARLHRQHLRTDVRQRWMMVFLTTSHEVQVLNETVSVLCADLNKLSYVYISFKLILDRCQ